MISVKIICIGKLKEKFWRDAIDEYSKRLSRYCSLEIKELSEYQVSENPSPSEIETALSKEAEAIEKEILKDSAVFPLCIEGKELSSPEFAEKIEGVSLSGKSKICFIIGSSHGMSERIKQKADFKLSFSKMTFPHQLFRVLLLEQIYRAFTILGGSKYHK